MPLKGKLILGAIGIAAIVEIVMAVLLYFTDIFEDNKDDGGLSPHKIMSAIVGLDPDSRKEKVDLYLNTEVDWKLCLLSVRVAHAPTWAGKTDKDTFDVAFTEYNSLRDPNALVSFSVPIKGNEFLKLAEQGKKFRVSGVISAINDSNQIKLKNPSITSVEAHVPTSSTTDKGAPKP